ncbi:MAG: glycosyltransferase family 2 protein [Oscillatoriaceae cyanobacterium Prado104]|nr:glycosyltransferase family 2 protein [Oscillatoriaceae cyanobacterium Prado104]
MKPTNIAVLMTCHNRKSKTLVTLKSLFEQILTSEIDLTVYLVDDGSTDGTAAAVRENYPQVKIFSGDGSLFWNGGMRLAFSEALKDDPDYCLWLNDDTVLYPQALNTLLETSRQLIAQGETKAIVAGSTCDPETGVFTYGGMVQSRWWHPIYLRAVEPSDRPQPCDTMNGNFVLIPKAVVRIAGNLDPAFIHYAADYDYGWRAKQQGCTVWIAPGYIGTCALNPKPTAVPERPLTEQLEKVSKPKGLALQDVTLQPLEEWKVYTQRHGGLLWPIYWLLPYRRLIWMSFMARLKGA